MIHFKPVTNKVILKDIKNLEKVTQILFSNKRKMIKKNIYKILDEKKIKLIKNLDLKLRPSNIEPDLYYKITNYLKLVKIYFFHFNYFFNCLKHISKFLFNYDIIIIIPMFYIFFVRMKSSFNFFR